jgi:hypothetical protein
VENHFVTSIYNPKWVKMENNEREIKKSSNVIFGVSLESILPTFYEHNCANFLAPIKSLTFTSSTYKLCAKLLYKKAADKMLVKLTPGSLS